MYLHLSSTGLTYELSTYVSNYWRGGSSMETSVFSITIRAQNFDRLVKYLQRLFKKETGTLYEPKVIKEQIVLLVQTMGDQVLDDDGEFLKRPHFAGFKELKRLLQAPLLKRWAKPKEEGVQIQLFEEKESEFNGFRTFSAERLKAMVLHLAYQGAIKGKNIYPTKLNKLLFYADFSYFYRRTKSMSGAEYIKLTHGPIYDGYQNLLTAFEKKRQIRVTRIKSRGKPAKVIREKTSYRPSKSPLSKEELRFLDWVIKTYGHLSTKELVALSHREMAYWDTHWRQPISYSYAKHLENLPPLDLLD